MNTRTHPRRVATPPERPDNVAAREGDGGRPRGRLPAGRPRRRGLMPDRFATHLAGQVDLERLLRLAIS